MRLFLILDWADHIVDIREQFPLDRDETRQIADEMGVNHPSDPTTKTPIVMTTDFVVDTTLLADQPSAAYAVKPSRQLGNTRTLEKLEIERTYWRRRGVNWRITTEKELATPLVDSLVALHGHRCAEGLPLPLGLNQSKAEALITSNLGKRRKQTISKFCLDLDERTKSEPGTMLGILRHLVAIKVVRFPEDVTFSSNISIDQLSCPTLSAKLDMVG